VGGVVQGWVGRGVLGGAEGVLGVVGRALGVLVVLLEVLSGAKGPTAWVVAGGLWTEGRVGLEGLLEGWQVAWMAWMARVAMMARVARVMARVIARVIARVRGALQPC